MTRTAYVLEDAPNAATQTLSPVRIPQKATPPPAQAAPSPRPYLFACAECAFGEHLLCTPRFRCRKTDAFMGEQPFVLPPGCPGFEPRVPR